MNIISCPSCGASVEFDLESKTVQCDYCSLEIDLNTSLFEKEIIFTGNKKDQSSFLNLAQLLHNSRKAENYNLAYDYCNQLVKLNATDLSSGFYLINIKSGSKTVTSRVTVNK